MTPNSFGGVTRFVLAALAVTATLSLANAHGPAEWIIPSPDDQFVRHSGVPRSGEPGIHNHAPGKSHPSCVIPTDCDYGFRAPSLRSGPGMTN